VTRQNVPEPERLGPAVTDLPQATTEGPQGLYTDRRQETPTCIH